MSKASYMSALILVEPESSLNSGTVASPPMKYAVLPAKAKDCIDALLLKNGIKILRDDQFTLPKSAKLQVLDLVMEFPEAEGAFFGFCVHEANKAFFEQLFSKTPIVWGSRTVDSTSKIACKQFYCTSFATEEEINLRALKKLLTAKIDLTLIYPNGGSLLHLAADQGSHGKRLIELLCEHGANVNAKQEDGATPLHLAVASKYNDDGDTRSVQTLLEKGACIESEMQDGFRPLHVAASAGWSSSVKILLAHGAKVDAKTVDDYTPLHSATDAGWLEVAQLLVAGGAELSAKTRNGETLLHVAAFPRQSYLYAPLVKWLFQNGVDIHAADAKGNTALHYAVKTLPHVLKLLTERGADINVQNNDGETPLLIAVTQHLKASVEHLVSLNPDFNIPGNRKAFYVALLKRKQNTTEMTKQMMQHGFRVLAEDANDPDILFNAIYKGLSEIVLSLLEFGTDVNQYHTFMSLKITPLRFAIRKNQKKIVQLLLDFGANVSEKRGQRTPIVEAMEYADVEIINMLMAKGVNMREKPTLLHAATKQGSCVIKLLLEEGFDWNAPNRKGETPLWMVVQKNNAQALKAMVSFGAKVNYSTLAGIGFFNLAILHEFLSNCFIVPSPEEETILKELFARRVCQYSDSEGCKKTIAEHLLKLEAVHENFSTASFFSVSKVGLNGFRSQCDAEVESMKLQKVGGADLTFFDVLKKNPVQIALSARDGSILEKLKSCDFKSMYPLYSNILSANCQNGCLRRERLNRGIEIFNALRPQFFSLPDELKEIIMDYLNDQDLVIFQKSFPKSMK